MAAVALVLKYLLSALFFFSAAAKLVSIDAFDLYIYSFHIFSYSLSAIIARLAIAAELVVALWLVGSYRQRIAFIATTVMLVGLTLFLVYAQFIGRTDSCHCFGALLPITPLQSIAKNAVLLLITLAAWRWHTPGSSTPWTVAHYLPLLPLFLMLALGLMGKAHLRNIDALCLTLLYAILSLVAILSTFGWSHRPWIVALFALTPLVTITIQFPPYGITAYRGQPVVDSRAYLNHLPHASAIGGATPQGRRQVVAFFTPGCSYCQHTAQLLSTLQQRHQLDTAAFLYVFPDIKGIDSFYTHANSEHYRQHTLPTDQYIEVTRGQFPLIVLADHDTIVSAFPHTNLNEQQIVRFLGGY